MLPKFNIYINLHEVHNILMDIYAQGAVRALQISIIDDLIFIFMLDVIS